MDIKYIEYVCNMFKNVELESIEFENKKTKILRIYLKDYLNKGQKFLNDCDSISDNIFDYVLDNFNTNSAYVTKILSKDETQMCIEYTF